MKIEHDYGLENARKICFSRDFTEFVKKTHKKVTLVDFMEVCKDRMTVSGMKLFMMGWGNAQAEERMAIMLVEAVVVAINNNAKTIDITPMFSYDIKSSYRVMEEVKTWTIEQEKVRNLLLEDIFDVVSESDHELILKLKYVA